MRKKGRVAAFLCGMAPFIAAVSMILFLYYKEERAWPRIGFFISAWLTFVGSSVFYTPFSYAVSHYLQQASAGRGSLRDLFYLFRSPFLLLKATTLSVLKNLAAWGERMALLLAVTAGEAALILVRMALQGKEPPSSRGWFVHGVSEGVADSPWFLALSVLLWFLGLVGMGWISLRYLGCKYLLLRYPEAGVLQALRIGRRAVTVRRIFSFFSAGCGLSVYAERVVEAEWRAHCRARRL